MQCAPAPARRALQAILRLPCGLSGWSADAQRASSAADALRLHTAAEALAAARSVLAAQASLDNPPFSAETDAAKLCTPAAALPVSPCAVCYSEQGIDYQLERCFPPPPRGGLSFLGFDTEHTPTFTKGVPVRRTALVQAASEQHTVLAHVFHLQAFPPRLASLVQDARVVKVGVGVAGDLRKLARDYALQPRAYVDLAVVASVLGHARPGLKALCSVFGVHVTKPRAIQTGDWERAPLRPAQREYAALDAQLSLWLLRRLHAAHGARHSLEDWAAGFMDAGSVADLCAAPRSRLGVVADDVQRFAEHQAQQEAARAAVRVDARCVAAMNRGLTEPGKAVSALTEIANARRMALTWQEHPLLGAAQGSSQLYGAAVLLDGALVARASSPNKRLARREAAVKALQALAQQTPALSAADECEELDAAEAGA